MTQMIPHLDITRDQKLGEGGFGIVYKGTWDSRDVAIKTLRLGNLPEAVMKEFTSEVGIMATLNHPSIVHLFGISDNNGQLSMVLKFYSKGDLHKLLANKQEVLFWRPQRWQLAFDVAAGLRYLHGQKLPIIHRDLKSLNVLVGGDYRAAIADFGLSLLKVQSKTVYDRPGIGSVLWMAPELFKRKAEITPAADVYALGIILWEIATRLTPWNEVKDMNTLIANVNSGKRPAVPKGCCSKAYEVVITKCWTQDRKKRPTAGDALALLKDAKDGDHKLVRQESEKQETLHKRAVEAGAALFNKGKFAEAFKEWKTVADQGCIIACRHIGRCYQEGKGAIRSLPLAFKYYKMAADGNDPVAQYAVAEFYNFGKGIGQDSAKAIEYYTKAADNGNAEAQYVVGYHHYNKNSMPDAIKYLKLSANQGNAEAQYRLATCYLYGKGVPVNHVLMAKYFLMGAKQKHAKSAWRMGLCYQNGWGVAPNQTTAAKWHQVAAEQSLFNGFINQDLEDFLKKA